MGPLLFPQVLVKLSDNTFQESLYAVWGLGLLGKVEGALGTLNSEAKAPKFQTLSEVRGALLLRRPMQL